MWKFEKKYINKDDISEGPINKKHCNILWLITSFIFITSLFLNSNFSYIYLFIAPILARLISLDLCYLVLPDIYNISLIIVGIAISLTSISEISPIESILGILIGGGSLLLLALILEKLNNKSNIGGGDIKTTAAAGALIGFKFIAIYLWIACILAFILYPLIKSKNLTISFGPALIISLWLIFTQKNLSNSIINIFN